MAGNGPRFYDVFPNFNVGYQFETVSLLLDVVFTWRNEAHARIADAERDWQNARGGETEGSAGAFAMSLYHGSVYSDAAAAQAAVASLAPFLEGFLVHAFGYLKQLHAVKGVPTNNPRWVRLEERFWNPRDSRSGGLVAGVRELRDALGLTDWISDTALKQLELLFAFRNKSMHFAFEWDPDEIRAFKQYVHERGYARDVVWATANGIEWMAFLKDTFLSDIRQTTQEMVRGFGAVARAHGGSFPDAAGFFADFNVS